MLLHNYLFYTETQETHIVPASQCDAYVCVRMVSVYHKFPLQAIGILKSHNYKENVQYELRLSRCIGRHFVRNLAKFLY